MDAFSRRGFEYEFQQSAKLLQPVAGAGAVTLVEYITGMLVNRDYHVWDYRAVRWNYRGQICLPFSLLWIPVSAIGMGIYGLLEE